ncbi:hypothetical protein GGF44_001007 [Coemansia sp. RSA 1694]|nr:hypothetical protein IWW47_003608 [Coemansia sp. RSA 2052]KAJ2643759.1 hypothetical protein GGF44_001007 [Coemansia sp. RSA 1694]
MNEISNHNTSSIRELLVALAAAGLGISVLTICLCLYLCIKRRELYRMTIFRVILAIQVLECLGCIFNLLGLYIDPQTNSQCRTYIFFSIVLSVSPLHLSVFCILYFQAILIHDIPLQRKWPRIGLAVGTALFSFVPALFTLLIPAQTAGMQQSYCEFMGPPSTRLFVFKWLVMYVWIAVAILIGLYSISRMVVVIVKRSREACSQMSQPPSNLSTDEAEISVLAKENRRRRRRSSNLIIAKALSSVIWFPITPIICLGFNMVYSIVWYETQREDEAAFIVDKVLQFLSVPLMAMTFYLSPPVRRAFRQYLVDRKEGKRVKCAKRAGRMRSLTPSPPTNRGDDDEEERRRRSVPGYYTMQQQQSLASFATAHESQSPASTLHSDEEELYSL